MLRLLPPMFEPSVQQIMLLQLVKLCCGKTGGRVKFHFLRLKSARCTFHRSEANFSCSKQLYSCVWRELLTLNVFTWDKIELGCSLQLISPQNPTHQKQTNKNIDHPPPPPQSFVSYKFIEMFPLYCRLCTAGCLKGMMLSWTS